MSIEDLKEMSYTDIHELLKHTEKKAQKYEELEEMVGKLYDEQKEDSGLNDIGKAVASFFGWI